MDERKQKLIDELQAEANRFANAGKDTTDHDEALDYLEAGTIPPGGTEENELLSAIIDDYETVCRDYGV